MLTYVPGKHGYSFVIFRYLTQRQSQLMDRRKNAEELLKWKTMLDKEETRVFKLEKQALKVWDKKEKEVKKEKEPSQSAAKSETEKPSSKKDNGTTKGIHCDNYTITICVKSF